MVQAVTTEGDWRELLRGLRARGRAGIPQAVIATALGVAPNTVARWASGSMTPDEYPHIERVRWLAVEALSWYRRFAPVLALPWEPGSRGEDDKERALLSKPGPQFSEVAVFPLKKGSADLIAYDFTPAHDYPVFRFLTAGVDRSLIQLSTGSGTNGSFTPSAVKFGPLKKGKTLRLVTRWQEPENGSADED